MVKMPPDVQETINKQKPIPVATADSDGKPNVVFITFLKVVDDETIYIADNFLNKTRANLDENPRVSIVTYDSENKKSFQVKGRVEIMTDGPVYEEVVAWVHAKSKAMAVKSAVVIRVEEVYNAMHGPDAGKRIV
ncbi:MAG TPA: pyridoxamine 5'-phosphate oxidase [Methanosarcinales archaeon]|nr:pyridoxamine 5'-phosphate oxidase [Methanosarcinales archaeon]